MNLANLTTGGLAAVLIHGCHSQAIRVEDLIIGNLPYKAGRAPRGLEVALQLQTDLVIWGTGASERDGKKEAQFIFDTTVQRADEIVWYLNRGVALVHDVDDLVGFMHRVSVLDTETQNTTQEVDRAAQLCLEHGKRVLVQVSSPTHIARCYMEGLKWNEQHPGIDLLFVPVASDTCFAGSTAADVVVAEPPHRGDNARVHLYRLLRPMFRLMGGTEEEARLVLSDVCAALARHGINVDPDTLVG